MRRGLCDALTRDIEVRRRMVGVLVVVIVGIVAGSGAAVIVALTGAALSLPAVDRATVTLLAI